ncbi:MAG: YHS domain-containing protein [Sandaracinaceae bacterium]|nr:YHS domain-containing protein [Sandaracinaceae bacterium]
MNKSWLQTGVVAVVLALASVGCGGSSASSSSEGEQHASAGGEATSAQVVAPGEATIGDTTTCPVSGDQFVVTADSPHVEYQGRTYYFCCQHCPARFEANPEQYVHPQGAATTGSESTDTSAAPAS